MTCLCVCTFTERVCCTHGELRLVLAYLPGLTLFFTPSLARLRASRAGGKRVGARLAGWRRSPGERGDEVETEGDICMQHQESSRRGFHQPFPACYEASNSRELPADWNRNANAPHRCTHTCTHMHVNM